MAIPEEGQAGPPRGPQKTVAKHWTPRPAEPHPPLARRVELDRVLEDAAARAPAHERVHQVVLLPRARCQLKPKRCELAHACLFASMGMPKTTAAVSAVSRWE
jgi:hypothetical protein